MNRRFLIAAGVIAALALLIAVSVVSSGTGGGTEVYVQPASRRDLKSEVATSGLIEARKAVKIGAEVAGTISEVLVEPGQGVRVGDPLVRIDEESVAAEVERLVADVSLQRMAIRAAELGLEQARSDLGRVEALHGREVVSDGDLQDVRLKLRGADLEVSQARERLRQSEAMLRQARESLSKTTIRAPIEGVVTVVHLREGEGVIPGLTNTAGAVVMEVADLTEIWARVDVGESEVPVVRVGQPATVEVDALPGREFRAEVREVALQGERPTGDVTRFPVRLRLAAPDPALRPGMSLRARILTDERKDVLVVPIQAVVKRPPEVVAGGPASATTAPAPAEHRDGEGDRKEDVVFVVREGLAERKVVSVGLASDSEVELAAGVEPGEDVVTGPYRALKDLSSGDPVRPVPEEGEGAGDGSATPADGD
ncbi:efflux RND transporter periplasmic adaptor subunit [Myxococcota bacterium]|nr:efflux RND transporter periplasmic adaptor subunit [Myxococcota bacterium]